METTRFKGKRGASSGRSDWSALCQTLYDGVDQEIWKSMYNTLPEAAKKVGVK